MKPKKRPKRPLFSSGPCPKRPGWSPEVLRSALVGRSHRSALGKAKLLEVITRCRDLLGLPEDWLIGIVPGSDTGAVETALWSLLGERDVDILVWEHFGKTWAEDISRQLKLSRVRVFEAEYGDLPDLDQTSSENDIVFTWNGTTSGVRVPNGEWISQQRSGLTICDATSAAFSMVLPWEKLDVGTFSWQKTLGGEAQHGMLILGPRAVARLESYVPPWPLPKLFQLCKNGKLNTDIFEGGSINTPSMLSVEDILDGLGWAESIGGLPSLISRSEKNLEIVTKWILESDWASFLAKEPITRSSTSICISISEEWFRNLALVKQATFCKRVTNLLEAERVGHDIAAHREAPPGFRIWGGPTVENDDIAAFLPWLDWAVAKVRPEFVK